MTPMESIEPEQMQNSPELQTQKQGGILDTIRFVLLSLLIVLGIRYYVAQPFIVSGDSMLPTFRSGQYLIVDEISYRFSPPKRGDVIILRYPLDTKKFFIKRIIGLPGETLHMSDATITVTQKEGEKITLSEPYVKSTRTDFLTVTLGEHEYYVLGDNRAASSDSRIWGPLPTGDIVGRPVARLFPFSTISWLPGEKWFREP